MTHTLELLRATNCALLAVALVGLVLEVNDSLPRLHVGWRVTAAGVGVYLVAGITGSAIKYLSHAPVDPSVLLVTGSGVLMIAGLSILRHRSHR